MSLDSPQSLLPKLSNEKSVERAEPKSYCTALFLSVLENDIEIAKVLLENGADPNLDEDVPALHVAVHNSSLRMVDLLVKHQVELNRKSSASGKTALYRAVESDQTDIAMLLLYRGALVGVSDCEIQGKTLLHMALKNRNERLALAVAQCSPPHSIDLVDYGLTALHLAVERGYIRVVQELINKGANINGMTFRFTDPLLIAVMNRDRVMAELLVRNGAKMNMTVFGLALHYAVSRRYKEMVKMLLDSKVARINEYNSDGLTCLHVAVLSSHLDMASLCIDYGADVNARCLANNLPCLYYASEKGDRRMVRLLLENGAVAIESICDCSTLLDAAILWRNEAIARMLIEKGATVNLVRDDDEEGTFLAIKILAELTFRDSKMLKLAKHNLDEIQKNVKWRHYFDFCLQELSHMRDVKVFNNVSFSELMSPNANRIAAYGRNEELEAEFPACGYRSKFPIYASMLSLKYAQARVRGSLLRKAEERFERLSSEFALPAVCAAKVLEFLQNEELKHFIRAFCDCRGAEHRCGPEIDITF